MHPTPTRPKSRTSLRGLRTICAWCEKVLRRGPRDAAPERTSHGICRACAEHHFGRAD